MNDGWLWLIPVALVVIASAARRGRGRAGSGGTAEQGAQEKFAEEMAERFRKTGLYASVKQVAGDFALALATADGREASSYLGNLFADTRDVSPDERERRIARFLAAMAESGATEPEDFAAARDSLIPVLRGTTFGIQMWAGKPEAALARRAFLPFLDVFYVLDRANSMNYVTRKKLADWRIEEEELHRAAWARLGLLADPPIRIFDRKDGPLWMVAADDSYEIERLLVPGWLASFADKVEGRPVAALPARGTLLVGGDANPALVERLLDKAERDHGSSPRRIPPALYTVDDAGAVIPYARTGSDALASKVRVAAVKLAMSEYEEQKNALERLGEASGIEAFIASYKASVAPDGEVISTSIWTDGVPTLLPRTDRVALARPGKEGSGEKPKVEVVPFERVEGRLEPVPDLYPPRYRTREFPMSGDAA